VTAVSWLANPVKGARIARWYRANGRTELAEAIEQELAATGRCRICGRPLSDPVSVERGVGPDCAARLGR
jgi:Family of unknown function (DUF6011)